jgi:hypothetical protein
MWMQGQLLVEEIQEIKGVGEKSVDACRMLLTSAFLLRFCG